MTSRVPLMSTEVVFSWGLATGVVLGFLAAAQSTSWLSNRRKRTAFVMQLRGSEYAAEYRERHNGKDALWPELHMELKRHGVNNYSIFYNDQSQELVCYAEMDDRDSFVRVSKTAACAKWWDYFRVWGGMQYNDDNTPFAANLEEVFHMD